MQEANVRTTGTTGKRQQTKTRTTRQKTKVYLTKDTKVSFIKPKDAKPITTLKALARALEALNLEGKKVGLTEGQAHSWLKTQGISVSALRLGLTQHKAIQHQTTEFFRKGRDMDYIMTFLIKQGITSMSRSAMYQRILKSLKVYASVPNDIGPCTLPGYDTCHFIELKSTQDGGLGQRKQLPGRMLSHKVNTRLGRLAVALYLTEEKILFLYGDIIENTRADWIIIHHYETYGRRNFGTIMAKFYPMQLNIFQDA